MRNDGTTLEWTTDVKTAPVYPGALLVSVDDFKSHARITSSSENPRIQDYLAASHEEIADLLERSIAARTMIMTAHRLPFGNEPIVLRRGPVTGITSFKYVKRSDGTEYTMQENTDYIYASHSNRIYPAYQKCWDNSDVKCIPESVQIEYGTGYGAGLPPTLRIAIMMLTQFKYENRDIAAFPKDNSLDRIIAPYRLLGF